MLIDKTKVFNNKVFELSENFKYQTIDINFAKITLIENFYKDIDNVLSEIEKLPMTMVYDSLDNNKTYFDARKVYFENMKGTEIPYLSQLNETVSKIIIFPPERIVVSSNIVINCFKFTSKFFDNKEFYYNIHVDPYVNPNQSGQVAIVVFLNKNYSDGEGLNFYMPPQDEEIKSLTKKDEIDINYFVQAKCNSAVLFDSRLIHGQHTPTDQFKNEIRYTQVIYFSIF